MTTTIATSLLLILAASQMKADPFMLLPQHMLPPPGITFTLAYDLIMATLRIPSVYIVQAILAPDLTTVIGYRNWFESEYGASYVVSLTNGSYFQSNINLNTRECTGVLVQAASCVGWSSTEMLRYDNQCQMRPVDTQLISHRTLIAYSSMSDLKNPMSLSEMTTTPGMPGHMSHFYQFTSRNEHTSFPEIKCNF